MKPCYVQIIELSTGHCVLQMGPHPERQAHRIRDGASINLNHDKFVVRIRTTEVEVYAEQH